jgi:hypothetical protein
MKGKVIEVWNFNSLTPGLFYEEDGFFSLEHLNYTGTDTITPATIGAIGQEAGIPNYFGLVWGSVYEAGEQAGIGRDVVFPAAGVCRFLVHTFIPGDDGPYGNGDWKWVYLTGGWVIPEAGSFRVWVVPLQGDYPVPTDEFPGSFGTWPGTRLVASDPLTLQTLVGQVRVILCPHQMPGKRGLIGIKPVEKFENGSWVPWTSHDVTGPESTPYGDDLTFALASAPQAWKHWDVDRFILTVDVFEMKGETGDPVIEGEIQNPDSAVEALLERFSLGTGVSGLGRVRSQTLGRRAVSTFPGEDKTPIRCEVTYVSELTLSKAAGFYSGDWRIPPASFSPWANTIPYFEGDTVTKVHTLMTLTFEGINYTLLNRVARFALYPDIVVPPQDLAGDPKSTVSEFIGTTYSGQTTYMSPGLELDDPSISFQYAGATPDVPGGRSRRGSEYFEGLSEYRVPTFASEARKFKGAKPIELVDGPYTLNEVYDNLGDTDFSSTRTSEYPFIGFPVAPTPFTWKDGTNITVPKLVAYNGALESPLTLYEETLQLIGVADGYNISVPYVIQNNVQPYQTIEPDTAPLVSSTKDTKPLFRWRVVSAAPAVEVRTASVAVESRPWMFVDELVQVSPVYTARYVDHYKGTNPPPPFVELDHGPPPDPDTSVVNLPTVLAPGAVNDAFFIPLNGDIYPDLPTAQVEAKFHVWIDKQVYAQFAPPGWTFRLTTDTTSASIGFLTETLIKTWGTAEAVNWSLGPNYQFRLWAKLDTLKGKTGVSCRVECIDLFASGAIWTGFLSAVFANFNLAVRVEMLVKAKTWRRSELVTSWSVEDQPEQGVDHFDAGTFDISMAGEVDLPFVQRVANEYYQTLKSPRRRVKLHIFKAQLPDSTRIWPGMVVEASPGYLYFLETVDSRENSSYIECNALQLSPFTNLGIGGKPIVWLGTTENYWLGWGSDVIGWF